MRICLLLLMIFHISCAQKDENSKKDNKYKAINLKREEFFNSVFNSFKNDVEQTNFYLNQYEKLKYQALSLSGNELLPLNELEQNFDNKHGENLVSIQNLLQKYETSSNLLQNTLESLKEDLDIINTSYHENLASFKSCKQQAHSDKIKLEQQRNQFNESLENLKTTFDSYVDSAKSHSDSASNWKKRAGRSNWPPDKKKYADKAKKHAKKAKSFAVKAQNTHAEITQSIAHAKSILTVKVERLNRKFSLCKKAHSELLIEQKVLEELAAEYQTTHDQLLSINQQVQTLFSDNEVLLKDFDEFKSKRDVIVGVIKNRLVKRKIRFEKAHQKNIKNYGPEYLDMYTKVAKWISSNHVDGKDTATLLAYLSKFKLAQVKKLYQSIYEILELASGKKLAMLTTFIDRNIASFIHIEIGGIKIPPLPEIKIELPPLPEIRIDLPVLPEIRMNLPSLRLDIPNLNITLPQINMSLPQLTLLQTLPNINFELPELMYFKLEQNAITTNIPELKLAKISWDASGDIGHLFEQIKSIRITLPSIEIVRIEADVLGDIQRPERIFQNAAKETTKTAENVYREMGNGLKEIRRVYLQSKGVDFNKLMKQLKKGVKVCRQQKRLVNKQVSELKSVADLIELKNIGAISNEEYTRRYEKMLKEVEILQGYGLTVASAGSLASSSYLSQLVFSMSSVGMSSTTMFVGKMGLIGIGVAAVLSYMASSAQKELEIEHDKIKECSSDLDALVLEYKNIQVKLTQDELDRNTLFYQITKRIVDYDDELDEADFTADDYFEVINGMEKKIVQDMLEFKESAILLGDNKSIKLIENFLNSLGLLN